MKLKTSGLVRRVIALFMAFCGFIAVAGCDKANPAQTQPTSQGAGAARAGVGEGAQSLATVPMKIGDRTFDIEVAKTPGQHEIGLMKRDSMPENHGMIFVFEDEHTLEFWMKDTRIPLDIMYLDASGKVVSVAQMQPYDLATVSSQVPAQYAIELYAGMVKKLGIRSGQVLDIPAAARGPKIPPTTQP
jgi:uncharacterized membrane protein (UPF0127 family)